jgi:uncharacterized membrane protein YbhN (UPF0104 family)
MERAWVKPALNVCTLILGLGLVGGAVVSALWHADFAAVKHAAPWWAAALGGAVLANLYLTALVFWVVTRSFDAAPPVTLGRMWHLTCASTLLNYIPLVRAGLVGRTAYLMVHHKLPLRQALAIACIVAAAFAVAAGGAVALVLEMDGPARWGAAAGGLVVLSLGTAALSRLVLRRPLQSAWLWFPLRVADVLAVAARLWFAFVILGHPITFDQAVVLGAVDMTASILPLTPNGLGLSEWSVAVTARAMAVGGGSAIGAAAMLVNRTVSVLILVPLGLWSLHVLRKSAGWRLGRATAKVTG